jgi:hypothetical protein
MCPARTGRKIASSLFSGVRDIAAMSSPANVTASASGRSRLPRHAGQSVATMNRLTRFFISALCVVANVWSTYFRTPMNVPM